MSKLQNKVLDSRRVSTLSAAAAVRIACRG